MTREKAIEVLRDKKPKIQKFYGETELSEAVDIAIKALEQEPVLDKIREIVEKWQSDTWTDNLSYECMVKIAGLLAESEDEG